MIDENDKLVENTNMETIKTNCDADPDLHALVERITSGKALDAETYQRIHQQGKQITEELRKQCGEMNIAVALIREVREEA